MRRNELDEEPSVASSDENDEVKAQLRQALSAKLAKSLKWDIVSTQPEDPPLQIYGEDARPATGEDGDEVAETHEDGPPETFEFRLFGASKPATTVILEKDRPFKPGEGTIVARRPISFYFSRPSQREREEYASVLITWEQIMEKSTQRAWGLERPWKTIASITVSHGRSKSGHEGSSTFVTEDGDGKKRGRKRLGKKTRIARRKRDRAIAAKKEAEEKTRLEKEEHIKAKKKRLNHVKKVRARAKAKQKKAAERAAAGGEPVGDDGGDMDEASVDISMDGS